MSSAPSRSVLSNWLKDKLLAMPIKAERVIAPSDAGWQSDGATANAEFIPYAVITPQTGVPTSASFDNTGDDWDMSYTISSYGVDPDQVEELADDVRAALVGVKGINLVMGSSNWRITRIKCPSIGGVGYTTAVIPTAYSQSDSFTLTLSRSLT
jgi:hypothetical protein